MVAARLAADQVLWLEFDKIVTSPDDASAKAEILLLSSSILVPCLRQTVPRYGIRWRLTNI